MHYQYPEDDEEGEFTDIAILLDDPHKDWYPQTAKRLRDIPDYNSHDEVHPSGEHTPWEKSAMARSMEGKHIAIAYCGQRFDSDNKAELDTLLDAWKETPHKPVLVISNRSDDGSVEEKAVKSWLAHNPDISPELAEAILIDKNGMIQFSNGHFLTLAVKHASEVEKATRELRGPQKPTDEMAPDTITGQVEKPLTKG